MVDEKVIHYDDEASDLLLKAKFKRYNKVQMDGIRLFFFIFFVINRTNILYNSNKEKNSECISFESLCVSLKQKISFELS